MLKIKTIVNPSSISGLGLFCKEFVPKNTLVWQNHTDSELILSKEIFQNMSAYMQETFQHYGYLDKNTLEWKLPLDDSRFMNHSDNPNLWQDEQGNSIAKNDILPGEEVTCNYRDFVNANEVAGFSNW